jgi:hypothetical protein
MDLATFLEKKKLTRVKVARLVGEDPSSIGKKLDHKRAWRLKDLVKLWVALRENGIRIRFGRLCEMAAVGLEGYDGRECD